METLTVEVMVVLTEKDEFEKPDESLLVELTVFFKLKILMQ